jgi:DNA-binding CsgD family transcriptional regulator
VALGELQKAAALIEWLEDRGHALDRPATLAAAGRCRALMAAAAGHLVEAEAVLEEAMAQHRRVAIPLERGRTLLLKGQVHRRQKEKRAAKEALESALHIFESSGANVWSDRARAELARVGLRPRAPLDLTATEMTVAELAARGLTTKQIAEQAFMSPKTVEGVVTRIYRKLQINTRVELANTITARRQQPP